MEMNSSDRPEQETMELWEAVPPSPKKRISIRSRILSGLEVLFVALGGNLVIGVLLLALRVEPREVLQDSLSVFYLLMGEAFITLLLIGIILRFNQESFRVLSPAQNSRWKEIVVGILSVPLLFLCTFSVGMIFQSFFPELVTQENPLLGLISTPRDVILFLISSLFVGGLKEEVQRAFVLVRFESSLGGIGLGLVVWSCFFGFGHSLQGVDNAVAAGVLGLMFGLIYIWRRSLTAVIIGHALFNTCTVIAYWFFMRS